jgi:hypothetical protein
MSKFILPGSLEMEDGVITAGVHTGPSEFEVESLRFVEAPRGTSLPGESILEFMGRVYDNSEGCLLKGDFKVKEA